MTHIKWAREKLFGSLDLWSKDQEVRAYLKKTNHPQWKEDRHYSIGYDWGADGIDVSYRTSEGGGFGSMDEPQEVTRWFRLTYKDVFGWDLEWNKPAGKLSEVVSAVSAAILKK